MPSFKCITIYSGSHYLLTSLHSPTGVSADIENKPNKYAVALDPRAKTKKDQKKRKEVKKKKVKRRRKEDGKKVEKKEERKKKKEEAFKPKSGKRKFSQI